VAGRVLILDDVITAGTAIRETVTLLREAGGQPAGVVIALDRQERGTGELSAIQEAEQNYGIRTASIIQLDDLVEHLESSKEHQQFLPLVRDYRDRYGVAA
jgi:orotate phosphoribosyltransferase